MPMTGAGLYAMLKQKLAAKNITPSPTDAASMNTSLALCEAIVEYFQTTGAVVTTVALHTHAGVMTGPGLSGPPAVPTPEAGKIM